jgi:hypothetical protein
MPDTSTEWGLQPHAFVESEFENGAGKCDRCAAPKEAAIHSDKARVDPMVRIAEALERIAQCLEDYGYEDDYGCKYLDVVTRQIIYGEVR